MFSMSPQHGALSPTDRPATVQITFQSNREVVVKDQPILRCQVVEPTIGDSGEVIASIPIKVSVRSTFTKLVSALLSASELKQTENTLHDDVYFDEMSALQIPIVHAGLLVKLLEDIQYALKKVLMTVFLLRNLGNFWEIYIFVT